MWKKRRRKPVPFLLILVVFAFFLFFLVEHNLRLTIISLAEAQARWTATEAIHNAILEKITTDVVYSDLIKPEKDAQQRIVFMQANIVAINRLASEAVLEAQQTLEGLKDESFSIPLGQVLGSKLLANYGPGIGLRLLPVGTVKVTVADDFTEAGINQTRHRIYLVVESEIRVVIPFIQSDIQVSTRVPIADAIIVGPVPETYVNFDVGASADMPLSQRL